MDAQARANASSSASVSITTESITAQQAALRLIARAEQCSAGLTRKLELRKYDSDDIQTVIKNLIEQNLVNDFRYAQMWLKSKICFSKKGPRILLASLLNKGIDQKTAQSALDTVLTTEAEQALLKRCLAKAPPLRYSGEDRKLQIKLFLKAEGFSGNAIEEYIEDYVD